MGYLQDPPINVLIVYDRNQNRAISQNGDNHAHVATIVLSPIDNA